MVDNLEMLYVSQYKSALTLAAIESRTSAQAKIARAVTENGDTILFTAWPGNERFEGELSRTRMLRGSGTWVPLLAYILLLGATGIILALLAIWGPLNPGSVPEDTNVIHLGLATLTYLQFTAAIGSAICLGLMIPAILEAVIFRDGETDNSLAMISRQAAGNVVAVGEKAVYCTRNGHLSKIPYKRIGSVSFVLTPGKQEPRIDFRILDRAGYRIGGVEELHSGHEAGLRAALVPRLLS